MTDATIFNQFLIWPFINLLIFFYVGFQALRIPGALGLAIIAMTFLVRGALHPLTSKQMESTRKMQALKPQIDQLAKKYAKDRQKLQQEQLKLYQKEGINPAAGCLPLLLQFPILIALYRVFWRILSNGNGAEVVEQINKIVYFPFLKIQSLDLNFFGVNLALHPGQWREHGLWLLSIPVITAVLQWYQTKLMTMGQSLPTVEGDKKSDDPSQQMQKQMGLIMPLMIGFFAYSFPVGLSLYWNTFTVFGILTSKPKK